LSGNDERVGTVDSDTIDREVEDLVRRAKDGDGEAFARLYDGYVDQVFCYILRRVRDRQLAEDLTSDVFLRAYRSMPRFTWQGVDIGAWFTTIARNRVTDHFKSARARLERPTEEVRVEDAEELGRDDPEQAALHGDMAAALGQALDDLTTDHREILELRFVQGLTVAECAHVMERTDGAIKALQYRALRALARIVRESPRFAGEVWS
jgi:RNA polymerase sigma-70 factor, ECF subfamily